jgi:hypothetical protein
VGFEVGHYDHGRALVIDPVMSLSYSTYLGPSKGTSLTEAQGGIAVDAAGDAYIAGFTQSPQFPTTVGAFQTSGAFIKTIGLGAFVTKFNAAGSALVYSTFLGGISPTGIAVDSAGDAYVTGSTYDVPPLKNAFQATAGGGGDAFVTKLNAAGSKLVYSTYLGGSGQDYATGVAVDGLGDAYVTGYTASTNFPTTPGSLQPVVGAGTAFVSELNPTGSALVYSTYLGGAYAHGIAVDGSGGAYVTGFGGFPTTPGAYLSGSQGGAFVAKLNAKGSALVYVAQLGGSGGFDNGYRIAVDGSGNAYVMGVALSPDFPTTPGAYQTTFGGNEDAFVTELNPTGTALVYSTFLGGSGSENNYPGNPVGGIAVDSHGNIYVTGTTWGINYPSNPTDNFPTKNAVQATYGGGQFDAFVAEFNPSQVGSASLVYSTYLGGSDQDATYGIAVDSSGNAYVTGFTYSLDFPTKNAYQPQRTPQTHPHEEPSNAFVTKIAFN